MPSDGTTLDALVFFPTAVVNLGTLMCFARQRAPAAGRLVARREREMLAEREAQLMSLTQRFADERMPSSHSSSHSFLGSSGSRRDSIFDRLGLSHKSEAISA